MRPAKRLPRQFSRSVSAHTKKLTRRRHSKGFSSRSDRWRKLSRKLRQINAGFSKSIRIWTIVGASLLLIGGVSYFLFSPTLRVQEIRIQRTDRRLDIEHVQRTLTPIFGTHISLASSKEAVDLLEGTIPDIAEVTVKKSYPSVLHVSITLEPLVARLKIVAPDTEEVPDGEEEEPSYDFLTSGGVYVQYPGLVIEDPLPLLHIVDWGLKPYPGTHLLDPELLSEISTAEKILVQQFGHESLRRTIYLRAQEYHIQTQDYALWFDRENGAIDQIKRYRTFLQHIDRAEVDQYIDLRIEDKVVYR